MNQEKYHVDPITHIAQERFGISYLFPYQHLVITNILRYAKILPEEMQATQSPNNQLVILPTGAGKSLCFTLPATLLQGITLIIFPLLALMNDQHRRLIESGITSAILCGGQSQEERKNLWERAEHGDITCILSNPETLQSKEVISHLRHLSIAHVVVDEAHIISQWGDSFRPAYLTLQRVIEQIQPPQITAFTATASNDIIKRIQEVLFYNSNMHLIRANPDRLNIFYRMIPSLHPVQDVLSLVYRNSVDNFPFLTPVERPLIIFCRSRKGVEQLANTIKYLHPNEDIRFYHAGLERDEKVCIEEWFFTSEQGILCATTAYGMGVDKKNIRTVIHTEPPEDVESYLQESGRGGRDKQRSTSILLYPPSGYIQDKDMKEKSDNYILTIARQQNRCRRELLLEPLEGSVELCGGCDICEGTAISQPKYRRIIERYFRRYRNILSPKIFAQLLAGEWSPSVREQRLYQYRCFGLLHGWQQEHICEVIENLQLKVKGKKAN